MKGYLIVFFICIGVGDPVIDRDCVGIPLTNLTLQYNCVCPMTESGYSIDIFRDFVVIFVLSDLR